MDEQRLERALRQGPGFATRYVARTPVLDESLVAQRPQGAGRVALLMAVTALLVGLVAGAIAVGSGLVKLPTIVPVPSSPSSSTSQPSASLAEQTPALSPTASMLPALRMPPTRGSSPAGEFGWTGQLGSKAGMHKVIGDESSPAGFRQTQLVFAIENDCFPAAPGTEPTPKVVAGLDGLYLEPYSDPSVLFNATTGGAETTAAYALPIGDRTLCAYLTWDAGTTPDELNAAREVLESIRGQPFTDNGIRITFTLPAGWDTG